MKKKTLVPLIVFLLGICLVSLVVYKTDTHEKEQSRTTAQLNVTTYGERIKNENTKGIDSRPTEEGAIRRRRQCESCAKRFTTYEKIEMMPIIVIKKDDNREPYDREKIVAGIVRSCHKRPVSLAQINQMVDEIETQIFNSGEKEIPTTKIGMIVMDKLKKLDEVAYVRFASVYREFKDVNTFLEEINKILK